MSPDRDDPARDGENGTPISQNDPTPGRLTPENALSLARSLAADSDMLHTSQYRGASAERVRDGCEAVRRLIEIHLRQARRDGRQGRQARRLYGQNVAHILRDTNEVNLRLAQSWLAVSLTFLPRTQKRRHPGD